MSLTIEPANPNFIPGNGEVCGNVIIENKVPSEVNELRISLWMEYKTTLTTSATQQKQDYIRTCPIVSEKLSLPLGKDRLKFLPIGLHTVPFSLSSPPTYYPQTYKTSDSSCHYYLTADMKLKTGSLITNSKSIEGGVHLLDTNPSAQGWQTKSDSKLHPLSLKRFSAKVTIPTAIGANEIVPIHITTENESLKSQKIKIRSKLIQKFSLPSVKTVDDEETVINDNVEEINRHDGLFTHYLRVNSGLTVNCTLFSVKFKIHVEVEASSMTLLKFEFPVIVGKWENEPKRNEFGIEEMCPGKLELPLTNMAINQSSVLEISSKSRIKISSSYEHPVEELDAQNLMKQMRMD